MNATHHLLYTDKQSPGALILSGTTNPTIDQSCCVDISDHPHLGAHPFTIQLRVPPKGSQLGTALLQNSQQ